jgi:ABC-type nitrate/sulfonate/bicarbonate transport system substrate-binding protein
MLAFLRVASFLSLPLVIFAIELRAQTGSVSKTPIRIIYSALTASNGPVWIAADQRLFEKYGLDVQIVHGRGATPIQALASGTVELATSPARR